MGNKITCFEDNVDLSRRRLTGTACRQIRCAILDPQHSTGLAAEKSRGVARQQQHHAKSPTFRRWAYVQRGRVRRVEARMRTRG